MTITGQILYETFIVLNGLNPSLANAKHTFQGSVANSGFFSSKSFHANPSAGCRNKFPSGNKSYRNSSNMENDLLLQPLRHFKKPQSDAEPELDANRRLIIREDGTILKRTPTEADLDAGVTDPVWSAKGYTDPTCLETGTVNHKSDMYSFGIVLFELLCETSYDYLNEEQSQRSNIDEIVTRLEKALELQLESKNIVHLVAVAKVKGISSNHEKKRRKTTESGWVYTGFEYPSKKAGGNMKRKGKLEPYAYRPLDRKMMITMYVKANENMVNPVQFQSACFAICDNCSQEECYQSLDPTGVMAGRVQNVGIAFPDTDRQTLEALNQRVTEQSSRSLNIHGVSFENNAIKNCKESAQRNHLPSLKHSDLDTTNSLERVVSHPSLYLPNLSRFRLQVPLLKAFRAFPGSMALVISATGIRTLARGIFTCCPSTKSFGLILDPDSPSVDEPCRGALVSSNCQPSYADVGKCKKSSSRRLLLAVFRDNYYYLKAGPPKPDIGSKVPVVA
uniref:Protein kinase domain-containing protein n=1 Tax=Tanacetum cinerariifolium TaxID=118510 RepID=A0A6L2LMW6_TANCI|nr:hypothetical protein [Tanacetum cinerariifolium]